MTQGSHCIEIQAIAGALGAEIRGLDLDRPLEGEVVSEIRQAFLDHLVLFFPDQKLAPPALIAFAQLLGRPLEYPQMKGLQDFPMITAVTKLEHETVNFGGVWHSDTTYMERPPMATMLYALETPPYGGDTLFANQYLAFETLSEGLRKTLSPLSAVNTSTKDLISKTREDRLREAGAQLKEMVARHPAVRTHPETGRRALYVNTGHTTHFEGWTEEESRPLLDFLFEHQIKPEFTCRFRWQEGSLALWDNRCTLHIPVNDYQGFRRRMHRISLAGDEPR